MVQSLLDKAAAHPRIMFLIDGFGAVLTAFFSGVVLVRFEEFFGMPSNVMSILAIVASAFAVFSFTCAALNVERWQPFMRTIALANTFFCCLTFGLTVYFYARLTTFGVAYFVQEWIVVGVVVWAELSIVTRSTK